MEKIKEKQSELDKSRVMISNKDVELHNLRRDFEEKQRQLQEQLNQKTVEIDQLNVTISMHTQPPP